MARVNEHIQELFDKNHENSKAVTFDEVTFEDKPSNFHPNDVVLTTKLTRKYELKSAGIVSAAMDTVTEQELALVMAKRGGVGIIHRNMTPEDQCAMVKWVRNKIHHGGMIEKPIFYKASDRISDVEHDILENGWTFTNFPILNDNGNLLGMVSRNEMEFVDSGNPQLSEIMIPYEKLVTTNEINKDKAYKIMHKSKVKKLPVIDDDGKFMGLYAWNDIRKDESDKELFTLDEDGRFLVGAAVGIGGTEKSRVEQLVDAGCKLIVIDTSHGANSEVLKMLFWIKDNYDVQVIVGNIASYDSARYILQSCKDSKRLPDGLKTGISVGSICTTRRVTGHGMPQLTAVYQVWKALNELGLTDIPIIADGGIKYSGDIVKAFSVGASSVMLGNVLAGTDESPGKLVVSNGQKYKMVRGMGSRSAMEDRDGSRMRYFGNTKNIGRLTNKQKVKVVPEGVEAMTKYRGSVEKVTNELTGGIRSGLAHSGAKSIDEFRENCRMWIQSVAGINEGNPHSLHKILDQ
jgi:IMP dehydrogenase